MLMGLLLHAPCMILTMQRCGEVSKRTRKKEENFWVNKKKPRPGTRQGAVCVNWIGVETKLDAGWKVASQVHALPARCVRAERRKCRCHLDGTAA